MTTQHLRLLRDGVHLGDAGAAIPLPAFDNGYDRYIAAHCGKDAPGRLVTMATTTEDWPVWEVHPAGDEVVIVVSGKARFIQDIGGERRRTIVGPSEAIVNPAGVPHTADVIEPFTAIYITPCPDTTHLPRERHHV
jgi:quercetin dioxygenase-like cupin family protein